ncbi:MAG: phosphoribosylformimino-5-aminoimidazole carboxamide ribotide isomerase [Acetivibrio ethanolgignens]
MKFRPCIDIHNGKVKQIVGSSLCDARDKVEENFVSDREAASYAALYKEKGLLGGHMILLNARDSSYYNEDVIQAKRALKEFPSGLQIGGGITAENAAEFIAAGASHVIVTSYVFQKGRIAYENLEKLARVVGSERLVLDLSCRKKEDGNYYVVTDRWQHFTEEKVTEELLDRLAIFCDEFLIHAVDVEGKSTGVEEGILKILSGWNKRKVTYAGGIHSWQDIEKIEELGMGKIDFTIGSSLDLFGGRLSFAEVCEKYGVKARSSGIVFNL